MPRVVPSQVVEFIDQLFPNAQTTTQIQIHMGATGFLAAIVSFAKQIPPELITLSGQDLADYVLALSLIENVQQLWLSSGSHWKLPDHRGTSPIVLFRRALTKCPDEVPSPATAELLFIADVDLRDSIRRDVSAANQDMVNAEWKGATVLAGSATEALLLWGIQQKPGSVAAAVKALAAAGTLPQRPHANPERWTFIELIEVALQLGLITSETATQARLGKDFRNLIHPGRAARLGQVCDRATALSALAAVEHVVRDLTP
jgi:hypothetical protein